VTVAPFFGSMKNTFAAVAFFAAAFIACALARAPSPAIITSTGSTSLLIFINAISFSRPF
jgi:hypothetical protein